MYQSAGRHQTGKVFENPLWENVFEKPAQVLFDGMNNYTDHLGNVRLSYSMDHLTGKLKILEENHYYPFGLRHGVYDTGGRKDFSRNPGDGIEPEPGLPPLLDYVTRMEYQYKFNGKEWQDELGLNFYDYGARNYDPAIGRWMNMDLFSEKYLSYSPYNYVVNNPVKFTDPTGMWIDVYDGDTSYRYRDGKLYSQNKETKEWDVKADVDNESYAGQILSFLNEIACEKCTNGKKLIDFFSNDKNDVNIMMNNKGVDSKYYNKTFTLRNNIRTSFTQEGDRMTTSGPEPLSKYFFLTLGHELAHVKSGYEFGYTVSQQPWFKYEDSKGSVIPVVKDEVYATDIENKLREDHNLNLRTHYATDGLGKGDDRSQVLEYTKGKWIKTFQAKQILYEIQMSKK